jgi:hypothetical protein
MGPQQFVAPADGGFVVYTGGQNQGTYATQAEAENVYRSLTGGGGTPQQQPTQGGLPSVKVDPASQWVQRVVDTNLQAAQIQYYMSRLQELEVPGFEWQQQMDTLDREYRASLGSLSTMLEIGQLYGYVPQGYSVQAMKDYLMGSMTQGQLIQYPQGLPREEALNNARQQLGALDSSWLDASDEEIMNKVQSDPTVFTGDNAIRRALTGGGQAPIQPDAYIPPGGAAAPEWLQGLIGQPTLPMQQFRQQQLMQFAQMYADPRSFAPAAAVFQGVTGQAPPQPEFLRGIFENRPLPSQAPSYQWLPQGGGALGGEGQVTAPGIFEGYWPSGGQAGSFDITQQLRPNMINPQVAQTFSPEDWQRLQSVVQAQGQYGAEDFLAAMRRSWPGPKGGATRYVF